MSLLRILTALPKGLELAQVAHRAAQGDPEALEYLRANALYDVAGIIMPGAESPARKIVEGVQDMVGSNHEPYDPKRPPWMPFIDRLMRQPSGGHIALGHMGTGKTELGKKLAYNWSQRNGYRVEWCGLYRGDIPNFGVKIHMDTLVERMGALSAYLRSEGIKDEEYYLEGEEEGAEKPKSKKVRYRPIMPPKRRIIVIDEMGMAMSTNAEDPVRKAVLQYLAQSRHVDSLIFFLAQNASQIPLRLLGASCVWAKKPVGDEKDTDRDNPLVRLIWEEAEACFRKMRGSPWKEEYPDSRSWAYVRCASLSGQAGYKGPVPFKMYKEAA